MDGCGGGGGPYAKSKDLNIGVGNWNKRHCCDACTIPYDRFSNS